MDDLLTTKIYVMTILSGLDGEELENLGAGVGPGMGLPGCSWLGHCHGTLIQVLPR